MASPSVICTYRIEFKSIAETGHFAGYASVFGVVDQQGDIVARGAFEQDIAGRIGEIKLLWQHDPREPIGRILKLFEDRRGLYVEARLNMRLRRGKEAYHLLKEGTVKGLSIGFRPLVSHKDAATQARVITRAQLVEISLVTFPANQASEVTVVKSIPLDAAAIAADEAEMHGWKNAVRSGQAILLADALEHTRRILHQMSDPRV